MKRQETFSLSKTKNSQNNLESTISQSTKNEQQQKNELKQQKNINHKISFSPSSLEFSVDCPNSVEQVQIRNISSNPVRVKFLKPQTKNFIIVYENLSDDNYMIPSGLVKKVKIQYVKIQKNQKKFCNEQARTKLVNLSATKQQYFDCFKLILQDKKYQIGLKAVKKQIQLIYEHLIDLGYVDMNKQLKVMRKIKNPSSQNIRIKLSKQPYQLLHIIPSQVQIKSHTQQSIQISLTPTQPGKYHHKIQVQTSDTHLTPIQLKYQTYQYCYGIIDQNDNKVEEVDFGTIFYGKLREKHFYAINDTPNHVQIKANIRTGYKNDIMETTFQSPQEFGQECSSTLVQMSPKNLKILPFSKERFVLKCYGSITQQHIAKVGKYCKHLAGGIHVKTHKRLLQAQKKYQILQQSFNQSLLCQYSIINTKKSQHQHRHTNISNMLLTELKVTYCLPKVRIVPTDFDFGMIILNKKTQIKIKIQNQEQNSTIKVAFSKVVGVQMRPNTLFVKAGQTKQVEMIVTPVNLGVINDTLTIQIQDQYPVQCRLRYQSFEVTPHRLFSQKKSSHSQYQQNLLNQSSSPSLHHTLNSSLAKMNFNSTLMNFNSTLNCLQQQHQFHRPKTLQSSHSQFRLRKNYQGTRSIQKNKNSQQRKEMKSSLIKMNVTDGFRKNINTQMRKSGDSFTQNINQSHENPDKNNKNNISKDIQFFQEHCQAHDFLRLNKVSLPQSKQSLFVTKKIDKYQPYNIQQNPLKLPKSKASKDFFSGLIKRIPRNRRQAQQILMQLKGPSLKQIKINTKTISFNKMFIGSKMQKQFIVQNQTEYAIEVKLKQPEIQDSKARLEADMLAGTDYGQQIIGPHFKASFKVCLWAKQCGKFLRPITYFINKHHQFQFLVDAQIQLAHLTMNKNLLKMNYLDDVSEMSMKDSFLLFNEGNATTQFNITQVNSSFTIQPSKGIVQPGAQCNIRVTHNCPVLCSMLAGQTPVQPAKQSLKSAFPTSNFVDERIGIQIKNGVSMSMRVTFNPLFSEPRCMIKQSKLHFGVSIVSKPKAKSLLLRNLSRTMALFQIQGPCPQFLSFDLMKGKLPPESSKQIIVTYKSNVIQQIQSCFKINIRGGLIINVPFFAQSVAPNIRILQENFCFGDLSCGTPAIKPLTVINQSQTMVQLLLDLIDKRANGTEFLYVSFVNLDNQIGFDDQSINEKQNIMKKGLLMNQNNYTIQNSERIIDNCVAEPQIHKLKISPKSSYTLFLVFKPKIPGFYEFQLPLYFQNFIKSPALLKTIKCFVTEPKFLIQPSIIKFKKKIISQKQTNSLLPNMECITLKNSGTKQLKWKIDWSDDEYDENQQVNQIAPVVNTLLKPLGIESIKSLHTIQGTTNMLSSQAIPISRRTLNHSSKACFQIQTKKGQISPNSFQCINIAFNPYDAGVYSYKLHLLIFNQEKGIYQQEAEVRLEGEGQYPTLFFDRKQLLMPVVPLGIQSVNMFKILNQGYETISLKHRIQILDSDGNRVLQGTDYYQNNTATNIPQISIIYPQGVKMGFNKKQLYIIVKFMCKKSISFTCKLQLYDNTKDNRVYSIPISGTTDNSILTVFPYFSNSQNRCKFNMTQLNSQDKQKSQQNSQNYTINVESLVNQNVVDRVHNYYQRTLHNHYSLDCQIIRRWINQLLKDEKVGKFPQDVISAPQNLLRVLLKISSRKQFQLLIQSTSSTDQLNNTISQSNSKQGNRNNQYGPGGNTQANSALNVPQHFNCKLDYYEYLIKLLKSMGCLLNHIRPYFLLDKNEFLNNLQKDFNWKNMSEFYTKIYQSVHFQSWIILFYQIISNFWYNTPKLKTSLSLTDKSVSSSNVYSITQLTVLKWVKTIYEKYNPLQDCSTRFLNFGENFKDALGLIYTALNHIINPSKKKRVLDGLTKKPNTQNQFTINIRILYNLIEKVGLVPLIYQEQFLKLKEKQMFLFLFQLYELLPQQLPKSEPIYFTCNLGQKCTKLIQIKNPSMKVINYWVRLQGSRDFTHDQKQSIKVEPKSTYKFKVHFQSRVSAEQIAYLTFLNKQQADSNTNTVAGTTLVFELRSQVVGRKSIKRLQPVNCSIYQSQVVRIPIENNYDDCQYANFEINLFQQLLQAGYQTTKPKLYPIKRSKTIQNLSFTQKGLLLQQQIQSLQKRQHGPQQQSSAQHLNFFIDCQQIKIKRKSTAFIQVTFNPIIYQKVKCFIIFHDPLVGEFQYQIIGITEIPKILQQIKYPQLIFTGIKDNIQINLPTYNNFMIKAGVLVEQKFFAKTGKHRTNKRIQNEFQKFKIQVNMDKKILQYVTFPTQFIVKNAKKQSNPADLIHKLKFQCNFSVVIKDLALDFLLINQDKRDVRRIKVNINLANKPIINQLIMKTTARVPIVQPIPIQNTSGKDWRIKAILIQQNEQELNGYLSLKQGQKILSKDFMIKRNNAVGISQFNTSQNLSFNPNQSVLPQSLSLIFNPIWICNIASKLTIHNLTTNQQLIYQIRATCQQPLSQSHLYFQVKSSFQQTKKILIKNPYSQPISFKVQTDIDQISVPQYLFIDAAAQASLTINMESIVATKAVGYLKFTDEKQRFFWYTVAVDFVYQHLNIGCVQMTCPLGSKADQNIIIQNTSDQKISYSVIFPQNSFTSGQSQFQVGASSSYLHKIFFKPTQIINKKFQLKYVSKQSKNQIHVLILKSVLPQVKTNHSISAEVGKIQQIIFKVQNLAKSQIQIKCQLSNNTKKYFNLIFDDVIQPLSMDHQVKLQFMPAEQGKFHVNLKITGQNFTPLCYEVQATAIVPFTIEKLQLKSSLNVPFLEVIKFRNPNPKKVKQKVQVAIQDMQIPHKYISILQQKGVLNRWQTSVTQIVGIPIQFLPLQKGLYQSIVHVKCANYSWKYHVKGTTSLKSTQQAKQIIQAECKKQSMKIMKLNVPQFIRKRSNFKVSQLDMVQIQHEDLKILDKIKSWINVKLQTPLQNQSVNSLDDSQIMAHQPIQQTINFIIYSSNCQSLRVMHRVKLCIGPSKPQQTIKIDADSTKKCRFQLNLAQIGVTKKGRIISCSMQKRQHVQCKFLQIPQSQKSSEDKISQCHIKKNTFQDTQIVQIMFNPHPSFINKGKHNYTDVLMIFTQKSFWSCQVVFQFANFKKR